MPNVITLHRHANPSLRHSNLGLAVSPPGPGSQRRSRARSSTLFATLAAIGLVAFAPTLSGCAIIGAAADTYERTSSKTVKADYLGLEGKSFVVLVTSDRGIQSEHPLLLEEISTRMSSRLSQHENKPRPSGFIPPTEALSYCYHNPAWHLRSPDRLSKDLGGAERIIIIEVTEYRLHDPGNKYLWNGHAAARVSVGDSSTGEFVYDQVINIKYPDSEGFGQEDITRDQVTSVLLSRLVDRMSWLFYEHEEKTRPDY